MEWKEMAERHKTAIAKILKEIKYYDYSNENCAILTDERLCLWLISQLRIAKKRLFNIIETLYGLRFEPKLNNFAQNLKDKVDIFSDEIKTRHFKYKNFSLLEDILRHDAAIVDGIMKFNSSLDALYDKIMSTLKNPFDGHRDENMWKEVRETLKDMSNMLDNIVKAFKERDIICNIKPLSLQKTYELIRKKDFL